MFSSSRLRTLAFTTTLSLFAVTFGQSTPPVATQEKKAPEAKAEEKKPPKPGELKKYDEVITKDAVTDPGLFKVHRIEDKVFWEIPADKIGRDYLWQTELAQVPQQLTYLGTSLGTKTVTFSRRHNKLFMKLTDFSVRAQGDEGTKTGVESNTIQPIVMAFDILTEGEGKAPVIDVTSMFTSDPQDFSVKGALGAAGADPSRSYVDRVKSFPENIETTSSLTLIMGGGGRNRFFSGYDGSAATVTVHYSLDLLPEKPMAGRLKDSRIGYFTTDFDEYGRPEGRAAERRFINRFRLEKKDPNAAVSEPVKPIVFYLAREVPNRWRPYLKKGIEKWQGPFEKAGFKNAIIVKDAPSVKEDPNWDAEDARYSVIRWAPSRTENAMGPSIQDPRSGETLSAHVIVWNDIVKLVEDWYFAQSSNLDSRAHKFPMSEDLVGAMLDYVVTHEVGHTLGLEHNFKASAAYTIAQLRDPKFTKDHGTASSIMSYSRNNYVAQPGDGVTQLFNMIGPYDYFAIEYGYKPIPGATTPDEEKPALDQILGRQVNDRTLRFGNYVYYGIDPTTQSENISDDPIEAGRLGMMNIDRIADNLLFKATTKFGEDYHTLADLRSQLLSQRYTELFHVLAMVGGTVETDYHYGRGGDVFQPVPAARQASAVNFLMTEGLRVPKALYNQSVLRKIRPTGLVDEATAIQSSLINSLLSEVRVRRLQDQDASLGSAGYTPTRLVSAVTDAVWSELGHQKPEIDVYRRSLQRAYLKTMDSRINSPARSDLKILAKDAVRGVAKRIDLALARSTDPMTKLHLQESRREIEKILDGKFTQNQGGSFDLSSLFGIDMKQPRGCWTKGATLIDVLKSLEDSTEPAKN